MSEYAHAVWTYISKHPGFRAGQIKSGVKAIFPGHKESYTNATLQRLKDIGFIKTERHPDSTDNRRIGAYHVAADYDEEHYTQCEALYNSGQMRKTEQTPTPAPAPAPTKHRIIRTVRGDPNRKPSQPLTREAVTMVNPTREATMVEYPYKLREGCFIKLVLPDDFNSQDNERITRFLSTLIIK